MPTTKSEFDFEIGNQYYIELIEDMDAISQKTIALIHNDCDRDGSRVVLSCDVPSVSALSVFVAAALAHENAHEMQKKAQHTDQPYMAV